MYLFLTHQVKSECKDCGEQKENWVCCECGGIFCSRYIKGHMKQHHDKSGHLIAVSLMDLSFWCYGCGDYVDNPDDQLKTMRKRLENTKFPPDDPNVDKLINNAIDEIVN